MVVIGIDPGANGGVAVINTSAKTLVLHRIPKKKGLSEVDRQELAFMLLMLCAKADHVFIEDVHSVYGSSAKANFSFGAITGFKEACLIISQTQYTKVQPKVWQKPLILPEEKITSNTKASALLAAQRLFPQESFLASSRSRKPHDGLVDAALIAHYGVSQLTKK